MIFANMAVLCFAQQYIDSGWYFKSAEWSADSGFPHMEYVPGVGYIVYITFLGLTLIGAMLVALRYRKTVFKEVERRRLVYIVIMCTTPFVGVTIARTHLFGGYDPTCIVVVITFDLLVYNLTHYKTVNVVSKALPSLYRDLGQGIIITDEDRRYLDSNVTAELIFPELKTWSPGVSVDELGHALCTFGNNDPFEINGRFYQSVAKPLLEQHRQVGYLITISDVTDMHTQVDEMRTLKEMADSANEAKSIFLANMSHEMRT